MGRGIFCVADCWRDSASRWYEAGIHHEGARRGCCCGCHCGHVFEALERRVQPQHAQQMTRERSLNLTRILEGDEDEIRISPVRLRESSSDTSRSPQVLQAVPSIQAMHAEQEACSHEDALCPHCCRCVEMKEEGEGARERSLPQVSLFYAMPTFLRELCGVTAFAPGAALPPRVGGGVRVPQPVAAVLQRGDGCVRAPLHLHRGRARRG